MMVNLKRKNEELVVTQTALKMCKHALNSANSWVKAIKDNLRRNLHRAQEHAVYRAQTYVLEERNAATKLLKVQLSELTELRRFKRSRAGKSSPAELSRMDRQKADLMREIKDVNAENTCLKAENARLAKEKVELDQKYASAKDYAVSIWLPTRKTGNGAGRGCASCTTSCSCCVYLRKCLTR